jgi:hypothetical protein
VISGPVGQGLRTAFYFAAGACVLAAGASRLRGVRYVYDMEAASPSATPALVAAQAEVVDLGAYRQSVHSREVNDPLAVRRARTLWRGVDERRLTEWR